MRLYIKNDGNVGIGCTDPEHNLQVSADNDGVDYDKIGLNNSIMSIVAVNQPSYGKYGFYFGVVNNGNAWLQTGRSGTANSASTGVDFNLLLQPKSGNVGIGTTNPETKLDIDSSDGDGITIHSGNSSGGTYNDLYFVKNQIRFSWHGDDVPRPSFMHTIKTRHQGGAVHGNAIDFFVWRYDRDPNNGTASTCAFTITPERIGIGTVNPIYDLQIGNTVDKTSHTILTLATDGGSAYKSKINLIHHGGAGGNSNKNGFYITSDDSTTKLHIGRYNDSNDESDCIVINKSDGNVSINNSLYIGNVECVGSGGNLEIVGDKTAANMADRIMFHYIILRIR